MIVYFAVILTVLMGFCGLAIDVGRMEMRTNQLQAAADAGALAGAAELMHGNDTNAASTAAYNDVVQVETANGIPAATVNGQLGSTFGFYVNDNSVVEVQLTQSFSTIFLGVLSHANSSITLSVKANAQMPPCALFMGSPTLSGTYDFWNASDSFSPPIGCPTYYRDGFYIDGFANSSGSQVRTSGPASASQPAGWTSYTPIYNVPVLSDPLAYVTAPNAGTCANSSPYIARNKSTSTTITLTPGTYCGKVGVYTSTGLCNTTSYPITPAFDIQGTQTTPTSGGGCPVQGATNNGGNCTSTPTVVFSPGLYIIIGGMNLNCVKATGSGVTLYFTKNSSVSFGRFTMISSIWSVSAPNDTSSGGIPGIAVMNDRTWTPSAAGATQDFQWTYGTYGADGVIYLTNTGLNAYSLGMYAPNYLNFVVANLYSYDAYVTPSNNYANLVAGNPLHTQATLVQ